MGRTHAVRERGKKKRELGLGPFATMECSSWLVLFAGPYRSELASYFHDRERAQVSHMRDGLYACQKVIDLIGAEKEKEEEEEEEEEEFSARERAPFETKTGKTGLRRKRMKGANHGECAITPYFIL